MERYDQAIKALHEIILGLSEKDKETLKAIIRKWENGAKQ